MRLPGAALVASKIRSRASEPADVPTAESGLVNNAAATHRLNEMPLLSDKQRRSGPPSQLARR
jgi:hypothetical protein